MTIDAQANLRSLRDVLRYAVTRFNDRPIHFGHGQLDAFDVFGLRPCGVP